MTSSAKTITYCDTCRQDITPVNKHRGKAFGVLAAWFVGSVILPPLVITLPLCWAAVIGLFIFGPRICPVCQGTNYRKIKKSTTSSKAA